MEKLLSVDEAAELCGTTVRFPRHLRRPSWSGKTLTEHRADRAAVVRQVLQAVGIDAPEADRLSVDVLHEDGQPRFVWDDLPVTGADYTRVLFASVKEGAPAGAHYEAAKQVALERAGTGCGQTFSNQHQRHRARRA